MMAIKGTIKNNIIKDDFNIDKEHLTHKDVIYINNITNELNKLKKTNTIFKIGNVICDIFTMSPLLNAVDVLISKNYSFKLITITSILAALGTLIQTRYKLVVKNYLYCKAIYLVSKELRNYKSRLGIYKEPNALTIFSNKIDNILDKVYENWENCSSNTDNSES
jgi:hypothetical protein